jgi:hypothetical protein
MTRAKVSAPVHDMGASVRAYQCALTGLRTQSKDCAHARAASETDATVSQQATRDERAKLMFDLRIGFRSLPGTRAMDDQSTSRGRAAQGSGVSKPWTAALRCLKLVAQADR